MQKLIIIIFISVLVVPAAALRWPLGDGSTPNRVGNNCYEFQNYGGSPYYHDGLDCMGSGGDDCFAVEYGYLRYSQESEPYYSGIIMSYTSTGDSDGWLYWHLTYSTIPYIVGDYIATGAYLGDIATWSIAEFHHTHFTRSAYTGGWYEAIDNPIEFMVPTTDNQAPTFDDAQSGQIFSFCVDNSSTVVDKNAVQGHVDIIAKIGDKITDTYWDVVPYEIDWWINGTGGSVSETLFVTFTGDCPEDSTVTNVVYKDTGIWNTEGNYDNRDFYFIITNTDGDGVVETTDDDYYFDSTSLPDGDYTLYVRAKDFYGNSVTESMDFTIDNIPEDAEGDDESGLPAEFALGSPIPNPSTGNASITYALPKPCEVNLELFDIKGRKIADLAEGAREPGEYSVSVNDVSEGVYLYRLRAGEFSDTKKLVVR